MCLPSFCVRILNMQFIQNDRHILAEFLTQCHIVVVAVGDPGDQRQPWRVPFPVAQLAGVHAERGVVVPIFAQQRCQCCAVPLKGRELIDRKSLNQSINYFYKKNNIKLYIYPGLISDQLFYSRLILEILHPE